MAQSRREKVAALLERHGRTYAEELGIDVRRGTPAPLFQLLVASLLFSARINTSIAVEAAKAVRRDGWTTARRLAESSWERRAKVLNEAGYAPHDERTATMLGDPAALLPREWGGALRGLRAAAGRDPAEERRRL